MTAIPAHQPPATRIAAGIFLRIGGMACLASLTALVKWAGSRGVPVFEMVMFRNLFAFVPLGIYIWRTDGRVALRTSRPMGHVLRSAVGLVGMIGSFAAVQHLPLAAVISLTFTAPLFMTAMSALLLREKVGPHRWAAVAIGFLGVLIMVRPEPGQMNLVGGGLALIAGLFMGATGIAIRQMASERGSTIVFYFTLSGAVVGLVGSLFHWVTPDPLNWALLAAAGLVGGIGQILTTQSLRMAPVGVVAPFDYTQLLWAALFGFLIWGDVPRPATIVGALVVAGSGLYILHREIMLHRARRAEPPAA